MIISVEDARKLINTAETDEGLEARLQALESLIRKYTHNNFQKRSIRTSCPIMATKLYTQYALLSVGDTIEISQSIYNDGVYVIVEKDDDMVTLDKPLIDESNALITKIEYPVDVKMGVISMLKWDLENRDKVGIQSETISRHSVTYFDMSGDNSTMGYPKSLLGFLKPYIKARF